MREISEVLEMFWVHVWKHTKSFGYLSVCKLYLNRHERGDTAIDTLSANARGPSRSSLGAKESGQSFQMITGPGTGDRARQMIIEKVGKRRRELPVCGRWWEEVFGVRRSPGLDNRLVDVGGIHWDREHREWNSLKSPGQARKSLGRRKTGCSQDRPVTLSAYPMRRL